MISRLSLWKPLLALAVLAISYASAAGEAVAQTSRELANRDTVGIMGGSVTGTYSRFAQDMMNVLDQDGRLRVIAQLGRGSEQNIRDLLFLNGVDLAIVQSDVLSWLEQVGIEGVDDLKSRINYVMKLYKEEIHFLVRPEVLALKDLDAKRVSIGGVGSGTALTATQVFDNVDIEPQMVHMSNAEAVSQVRSGKLAGAVFVVGKPASYFEDITLDEGLHLLSVELSPRLHETGYVSAEIGSSDYPNLVPEGQEIQSIAVDAVLAAYNWSPNSSRHERVEIFTADLIAALKRLRTEDSFHAKWKDVDPYATVDSWDRFSAAAKALGQ